jgi:hypothetical protein
MSVSPARLHILCDKVLLVACATSLLSNIESVVPARAPLRVMYIYPGQPEVTHLLSVYVLNLLFKC